MHWSTTAFFTGLLVLATLPVLAQTTDESQTLVLPLSAADTATDMARVITSGGRPEECLAPVSVTRIDGESRVVSAQGFFIEPGVHTINGRAILDITNCPLTDSHPMIDSAADLEVNFEPGGTYHVAYYHAPVNTKDWKLVVWHVETTPAEPTSF
jgi:hypothetical protein